MGFDLKGRLVLVTGATGGIGRAAAIRLAEEGCRLALTSRDKTGLEAISGAMRAKSVECRGYAHDLTDLGGIPALVARIEAEFKSKVTVLVNSAGMAVLGNVESAPHEAYHENLVVNFYAPLELIRALTPGMRASGSGMVVNISSGVGKRGLPGASPYCVSKAALNSMSESLRVELAGSGIHVLVFSPGLADTGFTSRMRVYGELKEKFEQGSTLQPGEIAEALVRAMKKEKREVLSSLRAKAGYHLNYWAPGLLDYVLLRKSR